MDPSRLCAYLAVSYLQRRKSTVVDDAIHVEIEVVEPGRQRQGCKGGGYSGMLLSAMS